MLVVACDAPNGPIESAPITSLPLAAIVGNREVSAFWGSDDAYYVRTRSDEGAAEWFRLESGASDEVGDLGERLAIAELMSSITPIGGGRVAFPFGSTGRRFYRVWRTGKTASGNAANKTRTRILEVRAGRSRRLPA